MREKPKPQMRIWGMLCHFSALLGWILLYFLVFIGIPLYLLPPLVIWRFRKSQYPWIDFQGKESLNFQITWTLYTLLVMAISLFVVATNFIWVVATNKSNQVQITLDSLLIVFMPLILLILIGQLFVVTFAAIKAYKGQHYRYPLTIRVLR
ncbi:DUF4870 domain-containing protein [Nostoc sp. JL33]|uniref:DUF4870 domain-containing protein n=1 Tax=Nostoc sp. JL33 TaxID=2815396 RepID=UPI0025E62F46|nr:DUF4870 domain-containing protein [Nostoc sp. JL33]MBN3870932.1 DUF4870 domain-containing protein [Nostoc sp. JL33]